MQYWLVKSDPETYGWEELLKDKQTAWTGIRSYAARLHLRAMKKGDLCLFYHSGGMPSLRGIAKVTKEHYQDPTTNDEAWECVDLAAVKSLKKPVTLTEIKARKELKQLPLVRIPRLSVMPVTEAEWAILLNMAS